MARKDRQDKYVNFELFLRLIGFNVDYEASIRLYETMKVYQKLDIENKVEDYKLSDAIEFQHLIDKIVKIELEQDKIPCNDNSPLIKGELNGLCNLSNCTTNEPAIYYNHNSRKHYCPSCARKLNADPQNKEDAQQMFNHELCTLVEEGLTGYYCVSSDALVHGIPCNEWCKDINCKPEYK